MSDAQVWTVIGVLAAAFAATITVTTQLMMKSFSAQVQTIGVKVDSLQSEMVLRFQHVDVRMDGFEKRMDRFESWMDRLEKRVDDIDRDVQAITRRVMPE